ncbi:MAG: alpha/beta hydrolase [Okeania sp. SIO3B5]|uniref:alpha/beta fold hydrolase n=1 Tax=Okeania sp. SIO3B5 TaxID=2607811 RepID=UPI0013FE6DF5|nr:alpha/beta hydrolase [Okeania sp. SIO3B5]NEO57082.1 alpha/beta hydrolase [Okeania sp. SIO3B5]
MKKTIKKAFLDTEDGQIFYQIGGEGEPLVLLHMTPRSSDEFKELMAILAPKYCVIAMDLMGLGNSDKPPREYSVSDYAKTVILLLDELGIKKCSILGSLTGGYIAGEVAVSYSDRLNKLILCNVHGFDAEEAEKICQIYGKGFTLKENGSHLMERWLARVDYVGNGELNHRCVIDDLKVFGGSIYPGVAVGKYCVSAQERFKLIQCPTLVCNGTKAVEPLEKYGLAKVENQGWLSEAIPHSKMVEIEGGNLWMINQRAEEISTVVVDFLDNN